MTDKDLTFDIDEQNYQFKVPITPHEIVNDLDTIERNTDNPILGVAVDNRMASMRHPLEESATLDFIRYMDRYGYEYYKRSLTLVLGLAAQKVSPPLELQVSHSIEHGYYYWLKNPERLNPDLLQEITGLMYELIDEALPIEYFELPHDEAIDLFEKRNQDDKCRMLQTWDSGPIQLFQLENYIDLAYFPAPASIEPLQTFELRLHKPGFILRFPEKTNINKIPPVKDESKLFHIYQETRQWAEILDVGSVGALNETIESGNIAEFIKISEALHEKKISKIADEISDREQEIDVVGIAGPSSSGKSTFSRRLAIQLRVNGINPVTISTDNYFLEREETPRDEEGNYDFESIDALDLSLLNKHLTELLNGETVQIPQFSFDEGTRKDATKPLKLDTHDLIIVEGLHGINPRLTQAIERPNKYLIYVSALTQLVIDNNNRISTSDTRLIRRIVRDLLFRNIDPISNIDRWTSVRRGEEKYIFPYQEGADVMFNSALLYELAVLRPYIEPALRHISENHEEYRTAHRILRFMGLFKEVNAQEVPPTSILREFIGGSSFNY